MPDEILDYQVKVKADPAGARETAAEMRKVGDAAKAAGKVSVEADKEAFTSKSELRKAIKGLRDEFPLLAHVARLAINPIALVVAGVGAAFHIWKLRINEAQEAMTGMKLPDLSEAKVGQVHAMAEAWGRYAAAVGRVVEAHDSVKEASERAQKRMEAELALQKKLLESQKNLSLSKLEADRAGLKPGEYEARREAIENFYEAAGIKVDRAGRFGQLQARAGEADALARESQRKRAQAAGIKVGTAAEDAWIQGDWEEQYKEAKEAKKQAEERRRRLQNFRNREGPVFEQIMTGWGLMGTFGATDAGAAAAIAQQDAKINEARMLIGRYALRMGQMPGRERARTRREELMSQAAGAEGLSMNMRADLFGPGGELDQFDAEGRNQAAVQRNDAMARAYRVVGKVTEQAQEVQNEIERSADAGSKVLATVLTRQKELRKEVDQARADLDSLINERKVNRFGQ